MVGCGHSFGSWSVKGEGLIRAPALSLSLADGELLPPVLGEPPVSLYPGLPMLGRELTV